MDISVFHVLSRNFSSKVKTTPKPRGRPKKDAAADGILIDSGLSSIPSKKSFILTTSVFLAHNFSSIAKFKKSAKDRKKKVYELGKIKTLFATAMCMFKRSVDVSRLSSLRELPARNRGVGE